MLLLIGSYFLLVHVLVPVQREAEGFSREIIRQELAAIGKITQAEKRVFAIFCVTALLWMFRQHLQQFCLLEGLSDTQIAIFGGRSEERRVGKESVSTCSSRCAPDH